MRTSTIISKGQCPNCGNDKGFARYDDGHGFCFKCRHYEKGEAAFEGYTGEDGEDESGARSSANTAAASLFNVADHTGPNLGFQDLALRRLKSDTLRRYGYFLAGSLGGVVHVAPCYDRETKQVVAQQVRMKGGKFYTVGRAHRVIEECQLFGQNVYGDRFDRRLVITSGPLNAMTVAQVMNFKCAVVSHLGDLHQAVASVKANYLWCDRFSEIILWFNDTEEGRKASNAVAPLFKVGKVRIARVEGYEDPSALMQADLPGDIEAAVYAATTWKPRGIVNAAERPDDVMAPTEKVLKWDYPPQMAGLQAMTGGIHLGEVIYHVAGTGVGKSSALREIQWHLIEQGCKIAVMDFESSRREAKLGIMSIAASERLGLVPYPDPTDQDAVALYNQHMLPIHRKVFSSGLVELFDPETAEWDMNSILGYIRYCASALGCKVIFIDPLSFVAAGISLSDDERRVLDQAAKEFARLAKELNISLQISHHLKRTVGGTPHEEGASVSLNELRGSGSLANFAMGVVGWERNNQAEGDAWRVTRSRIVKPIRRVGRSGVCDVLYYKENGRLITSPIDYPPIGKPKEGDQHNDTGRLRGAPRFSESEPKDY